jgi:hypothetical protein
VIWYKNLSARYQDVEANRLLWKVAESTILEQMILQKDNLGNFHCGEILLTYKEVNEKGYKEGDKVTIIEVRQNTNEKTKQYKTTAFKTQKA